MSKPVVIRSLEKEFGSTKVVNEVSFTAEAGTITTILGPSGCGKTTTLRCIAGLETPDAGDILFANTPVFSASARIDVPTEKRGIGMMFQSYALWPHMTVADNVAFGLKGRNLSKARIAEKTRFALALVQLEHRADAWPGELSGGQQQRVALARSLAYDPDVLLLDEPLANLDAKLREEMRFELLEVQARTGLTAIYVTHDQSEAMTLSHNIIVMSEGRIVHEGPPAEIYERPRNRFVAEFVGTSNFIDVTTARAEGDMLVAETPLGALRARHNPNVARTGLLMIRPDDIEVKLEPANGHDNTLPAAVTARIYQGDLVVLQTRLPDGSSLRAHVRRDHAAEPGMEVAVTLPAAHLVSLEA